ncbi:MAG: NADH-quinone oxidoreductase subunit N [Smithellaceae bacterium]|nr:NADH-quinone oxidoreductase subunit N [Smithellaceae bacterium]
MIILPELYILAYCVFLLIFSIGKEKKERANFARLGAAIGLILTALTLGVEGEILGAAYRVDLFSQVFKILILLGLFLVLSTGGNRGDAPREYEAEYFMFLGFSTLGLMMLVSAVEMISLVIALEISSFSLYVVVPLRQAQTRGQMEAAMKYLFFGAMSTGIMLYGMGYLYGLAHSTYLSEIVLKIPQVIDQPMTVFALLLVLVGFFFKLSLFPLHFWTPDIYEGSSNTSATFIATIPKLAAAALLIRIVQLAHGASDDFTNVLMVLAACSMTMGNLVALVQKDLKRLLAYSGIAHAGYLMIGLVALSKDGYAAVIFYSLVYLFMNLGAFYVILVLSRQGENLNVDDLTGLSRRSPLLAMTLAAAAFALAGIPPTGGFTGKFFLLISAFESGHLTIVIIAAVNTVISIFYYLNLVRMSYSREAASPEPLNLTASQKVLCYLFLAVILYLGTLPFDLLNFFGNIL